MNEDEKWEEMRKIARLTRKGTRGLGLCMARDPGSRKPKNIPGTFPWFGPQLRPRARSRDALSRFPIFVLTSSFQLRFRPRKNRWTRNWIPHTSKPINTEFIPKFIFPYYTQGLKYIMKLQVLQRSSLPSKPLASSSFFLPPVSKTRPLSSFPQSSFLNLFCYN